MSQNVLTVFLAVLVVVANAYCACASASGRALAADAGETSSRCPHQGSETRGGCHRETPADEAPKSNPCGHCTGAAKADVGAAKSSVPSLDLCPALVAICPEPGINTGSPRAAHSHHCGLPPPLPPPTLLNLSCALNN